MSAPISIKVDLRLYSKEALSAVLYELSGDYNVGQEVDESDENFVNVTLVSKDNASTPINAAECIENAFTRMLIDQQLRIHINSEFGHIRDLIVEEAFRPISK